MKTKEASEDYPAQPPSDRDIVKAFIAEGELFAEQAKTVENEDTARTLRHAAEARRVLADRLQAGKIARAEYVKEAGERLVKAATEAGEKLAGVLNSWYQKAETYEDRDRK